MDDFDFPSEFSEEPNPPFMLAVKAIPRREPPWLSDQPESDLELSSELSSFSSKGSVVVVVGVGVGIEFLGAIGGKLASALDAAPGPAAPAAPAAGVVVDGFGVVVVGFGVAVVDGFGVVVVCLGDAVVVVDDFGVVEEAGLFVVVVVVSEGFIIELSISFAAFIITSFGGAGVVVVVVDLDSFFSSLMPPLETIFKLPFRSPPPVKLPNKSDRGPFPPEPPPNRCNGSARLIMSPNGLCLGAAVVLPPDFEWSPPSVPPPVSLAGVRPEMGDMNFSTSLPPVSA